jgi:hypothetical protein
MRRLMPLVLAALLVAGSPPRASTETPGSRETAIADFRMTPDARWQFFTDQVMGGVSTGGVVFAQEDGKPYARMTGRVSTANRGGFIQKRRELASPPPAGTTGVRLVVRGNDQRYFVHLRSSGTLLPWQYYQAGFEVTEGWTEIHLPFEAFAPSGALLRRVPRAASLTSVAVVAYGRDHDARIDVQSIGFY